MGKESGFIYALERLSLYNSKKYAQSLVQQVRGSIAFQRESIVQIFEFLWDLAIFSPNGEIILYPFNVYKDGYGVAEAVTRQYYPQPIAGLDEWDISRSHCYPKKIAYIFDRNNPAAFEAQAVKFLAGILADFQTFVIRVRGMHSYYGTPTEVLIIIDRNGVKVPSVFKSDPKKSGPGSLVWAYGSDDDYKEFDFCIRWNDIAKNLVLLKKLKGTSGRIDPQLVYDVLESFAFIHDYRYPRL